MDDVTSTILIIIIFIVLFFLLRSINLWYWKIDDIVDENVKQTDILKKILDKIDKKNLEEKSQIKNTLDNKEDFTIDKND